MKLTSGQASFFGLSLFDIGLQRSCARLLVWQYHGYDNRCNEYEDDYAQGDDRRDLYESGNKHLGSYKDEDYGNTLVQVAEHNHTSGQGEVEGSQAQDGEDIGGVNDCRVEGDSEDGGY